MRCTCLLYYFRIPVLPVFYYRISVEYTDFSLYLFRLCAERRNYLSYKWRRTSRHPLSQTATHTLQHLLDCCRIDEYV